ncbi:MAG: hypothetical protein ACI94Y_002794 [Maribacter sp.]
MNFTSLPAVIAGQVYSIVINTPNTTLVKTSNTSTYPNGMIIGGCFIFNSDMEFSYAIENEVCT